MTEPATSIRPETAFHVMTKPIGPICNLDCRYCFYLEKESLYPGTRSWRMTDEVLESHVRQYIESQQVPEISFAWQGGEPTLLGLEFFRRAVAFQKKYCPPDQRVANAMQTNGVLLNEAWCEFFRENQFLIGLSIDGPRELHDHYRLDKGGRPTFDRVFRAMELMKQHQVEFNTLTVVSRANSRRPLDVYRFLREHGSGFMQFIPLVERAGEGDALAAPPSLAGGEPASPVTPWSVEATAFGDFLCTIFDEWIHHDVGQVFVQLFEVHLGTWMGLPASLCVFAETCGNALALEHNGDLYSCDHYVYPSHRLGNILHHPMAELVQSSPQRRFGAEKRDLLPRYCRECDVRSACNGECPKHRFLRTPDGEPGLNYLCAGYKRFFHHIDPLYRVLARMVQAGQPATLIRPWLAEREAAEKQRALWAVAGRNDPCPCGSGHKFKRCCWEKSRGAAVS